MNFPHGIEIRSNNRVLVAADSFSIADNAITFLFGESGIGKSLLSHAVYGLLDHTELAVTVNGEPYVKYLSSALLAAIQKHGFFVFQEPSSHLYPLSKISQQLCEGSLGASTVGDEILSYFWKGVPREELAPIIDIYPKPFRPSGGEKQRALLSMAFRKLELFRRQDSGIESLFVFDEPTGSLDNSYRNLFLKALCATFVQRPFTGLVITHDYSIISEMRRSFPKLSSSIAFKELRRAQRGRVTVSDFAPHDYLDWLGSVGCQGQAALGPAEPFFKMAGKFEVLGRSYRICEDAQGSRECPLQIAPGQLVYLKAASGVGKTTLSKVIMGLLPAKKFSLKLGSLELTHKSSVSLWRKLVWGRLAGMVFQHADEAMNVQSTVKETFAGLPSGMNGGALRTHLGLLFSSATIDAIMHKRVAYLSGGQKQRLNILRTLATRTPFVVLDEPLNGLDFESVKKVLALLEHLRAQGSALLMISHNEEIFDTIAGPQNTRYLSLVE